MVLYVVFTDGSIYHLSENLSVMLSLNVVASRGVRDDGYGVSLVYFISRHFISSRSVPAMLFCVRLAKGCIGTILSRIASTLDIFRNVSHVIQILRGAFPNSYPRSIPSRAPERDAKRFE